jgi:hypothetical protein
MSRSFDEAIRKKFGKVKKTRGRNGVEYRVCCPFCPTPDDKYHLYINPEYQGGSFNCYRCKKRGRGAGSMEELLGVIGVVNIRQQLPKKELPQEIPPPGSMRNLTELDAEHPAIIYLTKIRKRPFDPEELSRSYGVMYCEQGRRFGSGDFMFDTTNTLVFPVWMWGKLVGWQARLLYDPDKMDDGQCAALGFLQDKAGKWLRPPKYFTSPGMEKGRILYNWDVARTCSPIVVTEGVFDAMAVGPAGVAIFGKGVSELQERILKTYCENVVIMLDPGDAREESRRLLRRLALATSVLEVELKGEKDPGDTSTDEIWRQITDQMEAVRAKRRVSLHPSVN